MKDDRIPKIFISYSWSRDILVMELAQRLVSHGVDVVLDKWDLKEGQDKYEFMERCVNDSEITKVLIICDKSYAQKANDRTGGVGDETVIISSEIYGNMKQEKFIPIITEKDKDGIPYVPQYIKTRIYIDLSDQNTYEFLSAADAGKGVNCQSSYEAPGRSYKKAPSKTNHREDDSSL